MFSKILGTPKTLNTTTLMCIKHILRRNILCFNNLQQLLLTFILLFNCISSSFLHLSSMMYRNVVADHSSKRTSPTHADILHYTHTMVNIIIYTLGSQTLPTFFLSSSLVFSTCLFTGLSLWQSLLRRLLDWSSHFNRLHSSPNFKHCDSN